MRVCDLASRAAAVCHWIVASASSLFVSVDDGQERRALTTGEATGACECQRPVCLGPLELVSSVHMPLLVANWALV